MSPDPTKVPLMAARPAVDGSGRTELMVAGIALLSAVSLYLFRALTRLTSWEFGDETEYFVAAQMIVKGHHLYRDIFMQHGPLPVMISHFYAAFIDGRDFGALRLAPILLVFASCMAVLLSPVFHDWRTRIFAVTVYVSMLSAVWLPTYMNMLIYPSIAGYLLVILISQCVVPLYFREEVGVWNAIVGGSAFALAAFTAYQFFLSGLFFILSGWVAARTSNIPLRDPLKGLAVGYVTVTAAVVGWLVLFGDLQGYLIDHFYFNQRVYSQFVEFSVVSILNSLSLSVAPLHAVQSAATVLMGVWMVIFFNAGRASRPDRSLQSIVVSIGLIALGIMLTNPLGDTGHRKHASLLINFALFAIASAILLQREQPTFNRWASAKVIVSAVMAILVVEWAGSVSVNPFESAEADGPDARLKPLDSEVYRFVRSITREDGDLLALEYYPVVYIRAGRLPVSGTWFYFPWLAAYNRVASEAYRHDVCSDIRQRKPAVIWLFNWRVWNQYSLEEYEPCVLPLIAQDYVPIGFNSPWHVRKEILEKYAGELPTESDVKAWPQKTLRQTQTMDHGSLRLSMTVEHERRALELRRLGILFAARSPHGEAELELGRADGTRFSTGFPLASVIPDRYHFFDVPPGIYKVGEIRSEFMHSIRLWQGHMDQTTTVCMVYEYVDGSRGYTPACPILDPYTRNAGGPGS